MLRIREVIVVEGRYDKNALSQVVDAIIVETLGFGIYNDAAKRKLLRTLAEARGLIVLTDSDGAGFQIRSFIPDVYGKERRKRSPSKEGKLGVEGMPPQVLLDALLRAGATVEDGDAPAAERIRKADLYACGLSGREGSAERRKALLEKLDLPERLSADGLLDVLNATMSREEFYRFPV